MFRKRNMVYSDLVSSMSFKDSMVEWKESWLCCQTGLDSIPISSGQYSQLRLSKPVELYLVCFLSCEMDTMIVDILRVIVRFNRVCSFVNLFI